MQIEVNNLQFGYDDRGEGTPVLFVHGYPLNRNMWQPQVEGLSGMARALALDLRGHGESQVTAGPYWMDLLAKDCAAFLDALGVTRPVVVCGLSMGGYVAMAFYRQFEPRLAGLILAATRAGADSEEGRAGRDKAAQLAREKGPAAIAESMLPRLMSPKTYEAKPELVSSARKIMEGLPVEAIVGDLEGMKERPDSAQTLAEISLPTLILHGADDQLMPPSEAQAMHRMIPGSQIEILPEAGHLLNLEQPERFNQAVGEFFKKL